MPVTIETLILGPLEVNSYVVRCGDDCWVIDPADGPGMVDFLQKNSLHPSRILLTHGHFDHIAGVPEVRKAFPKALVCCPAADAAMLTDPMLNLSGVFGFPQTVGPADEQIQPGQALTCGDSQWQVLDSSGHTPGGVSFYCPVAKAVMTGDALFAGSMGRVDFPGASASRLVKNIRVALMSLPDDTRVLPGHGEETTIGRERHENPFVKDFCKSR